MSRNYQHINMVGIELEGGWSQRPKRSRTRQVVHDGSVVFNSSERASLGFVGEVVSTPISTRVGIPNWVKRNYPAKTNKSCGMHVHISLRKTNHYLALCSGDFIKAFHFWALAFIEAHPDFDLTEFKNRLDGRNEYCKQLHTLTPESLNRTLGAQVTSQCKESSRYYQLNFCHAFHGTLECRLFPCFSKMDEALVALGEYLQFVERWLSKNGKRFGGEWSEEVSEKDASNSDLSSEMKELRTIISL